MHARATFSESGPVFSSSFSEFWNKKKLTHSRGRWSLVVSLRWSISKRRLVLEHSTAVWCCTPLENAFRLVFEAFFLARRFAKIDYSWCDFFSFPQIHTKLPLKALAHNAREYRDTHSARVKEEDRQRKDQQQKIPPPPLWKNTTPKTWLKRCYRCSSLCVMYRKSCFKFMCTFSRKTRRRVVGLPFGPLFFVTAVFRASNPNH